MLTVATLIWDPNQHSQHFSTHYDERWVERLYRGFARNLTVPFQFRCYTDRLRFFEEPAIKQSMLRDAVPTYGSCIEPFGLGAPMIVCGLDTVIVGNVDHLADYCMTADTVALPRDPYCPGQAINGVCLVPAGKQAIYERWTGQNDMEWLRLQEHVFIDDLFPGDVISYKGAVVPNPAAIHDARIVYFHGTPKMHELIGHVPWVKEHWA